MEGWMEEEEEGESDKKGRKNEPGERWTRKVELRADLPRVKGWMYGGAQHTNKKRQNHAAKVTDWRDVYQHKLGRVNALSVMVYAPGGLSLEEDSFYQGGRKRLGDYVGRRRTFRGR